MSGSRQDALHELMSEALELCLRLQGYTDENFDAFMEDDDEIIIEIINTRDKIIEALAGVETRIEDILNAENAGGQGLAKETDTLWSSIRAALADISAKDMQIMKLLSGRMQYYRDETLKARSKQSLSAYMRSAAFLQEPGDSIDLSN